PPQAALSGQGKRAPVDGAVGPRTIPAATTADQARLVDDYASIYEAYLGSLPAFATFGQGWLNRVAEIGAAAHMTGALASTPIDQGGTTQTGAAARMSGALEA